MTREPEKRTIKRSVITFPYQSVHLMGIGGAGMSPLAHLLLRSGVRVSGCDYQDSEVLHRLRADGADVQVGHCPSHINGQDALIISSAIKEENHERQAAVKRGIPVLHRVDVLALLMEPFFRIAVAGSHGKTTTTAMLGFVLEGCGLDPLVVVGADCLNWGRSYRFGAGSWFVTEADESDRSFLRLSPDIAVITNIELDHPNGYKDLDDIKNAFLHFLQRVRPGGTIIFNGLCPNARALLPHCPKEVRTLTFGRQEDDLWLEQVSWLKDGRWTARLQSPDGEIGFLEVRMPGAHNLVNAGLAVAAAFASGAEKEGVLRSLQNFLGVKRRLEIVSLARRIILIDDYAHHPTEIRASIEALQRTFEPKRLWLIFQPHRYSRTERFLKELSASLADADGVWLTDIYPADEVIRTDISSTHLIAQCAEQGIGPIYYRRKDQWEQMIEEIGRKAQEGDLVVVMGAGDISRIVPKLRDRLSKPSADRDEGKASDPQASADGG
ncbi:MAG: UDP-N-acetylmuramate--L-alanine ligase [Armatimonadetes bacterium]|nr:UDP-N-acetylmuramate--L-alanine ligase [Armatimonadota bacterium]MDW8123061.1 UDP-N-acetylmuramate--L-alanine ligase [Armatimonadota bacterium]